MSIRRIDVPERRARLALRHRLAPEAHIDDLARLAGDLVGLHGTDPVTVYLAALARMRTPHLAAVDDALYESRTLLRMLAMRRTMFVLPVDLIPTIQAAASRAVAARERSRTLKMLTQAGFPDAPEWFAEVEEKTLGALTELGSATAAEIGNAVPELRRKVVFGAGTKWATEVSLSSRVLLQLAVDGRVVRGRPRGSWVSTLYTWTPTRAWLGADLTERDEAEAQVEVARRWLRAFGPATVDDLTWWTGWTKTVTRRALSRLDVAEVDLDGTLGVALADDLEPVSAPEPWVALLPPLDPTAMGWTNREWYLGPHRPALFDSAGNIGPTVWSDGRIVGGWAQRPDAAVVVHLLEDVGADARAAVARQAELLAGWLGETRVSWRFPTPLEKQLARQPKET